MSEPSLTSNQRNAFESTLDGMRAPRHPSEGFAKAIADAILERGLEAGRIDGNRLEFDLTIRVGAPAPFSDVATTEGGRDADGHSSVLDSSATNFGAPSSSGSSSFTCVFIFGIMIYCVADEVTVLH